MNHGDSIVAISSATGPAARMVVRVSGPAARVVTANVCRKSPTEFSSGARRTKLFLAGVQFYAWVYSFVGPRSYTGEDLAEFHIPGNPVLAKMLLDEAIRLGARPAAPGEFTARAYFNGKLDLTQAEGVATAVAAQSAREIAAARQLMAGELARRLRPIMDLIAQYKARQLLNDSNPSGPQPPRTVAYQGEPGAFSDDAARRSAAA